MKWLLAITVVMFGLGSWSASAADDAPKDGAVKIEEAAKQIESGIPLLDVRTADEWETGHLKGAKRVTFGEVGFTDKAKALVDPKKPVLVYCRSGKRTVKAAKELREAGFTNVLEMEGGILAWQKAGKPVVKGK